MPWTVTRVIDGDTFDVRPKWVLDGKEGDRVRIANFDAAETNEYQMFGESGLEMYDFHARHFDPQLARWIVPDPAMQFSNPYLGIGNNPVMYVDPDGEFIVQSVMIGGFVNSMISGMSGANSGEVFGNFGIGALAGAASGGVAVKFSGGIGFIKGAIQGGASGFTGGFISGAGNSWLHGDDVGQGLMAGMKIGGKGALIGGALGGLGGGIRALKHKQDLNFWTGKESHIGRGKFSLNNTPRPANKIYMARATKDGFSRPISMENYKNLQYYSEDLRMEIAEELRNPISEIEPYKSASLANSKGKVAVTSSGYIPEGQSATITNPNHLKQTVLYGPRSSFDPPQAASFYDVKSLDLLMTPPALEIPQGFRIGNTFHDYQVIVPFESIIYYYVP